MPISERSAAGARRGRAYDRSRRYFARHRDKRRHVGAAERALMHGTTYGSLNWRDRAKERKRRAEELNDTLAAYCRFYWRVRMGDLALEPYGIRLVPNDRVVHIHEDWPGQDRRKVSGSVWDGRKLTWRRPEADQPLCRHCSARWVPRSNGSQIWWLLTD